MQKWFLNLSEHLSYTYLYKLFFLSNQNLKGKITPAKSFPMPTASAKSAAAAIPSLNPRQRALVDLPQLSN